MANEIGKIILEHADSIANREIAIEKALQLGMSMAEIKTYLDFLDNARPKRESDQEKDRLLSVARQSRFFNPDYAHNKK